MAGRAVAKALAMGEDGEEGAGIPKKSKAKKIVILLTILIMMGALGGGGWYWWFFIREPTVSEGSVEAEDGSVNADGGSNSVQDKDAPPVSRIERKSTLPRSAGVVVPLPEFVVNLSDPTGKRYLKIGMEVEANSDISAQVKLHNAKIRDAVITLLAGKTFADVSTIEGKVMLKTEVAARLNQILGAQKVVRVYFTQFVVE